MNWQAKVKLSLTLSFSIRVKFTITFAAKISSFLMRTKRQGTYNWMLLLLVALIASQTKGQK